MAGRIPYRGCPLCDHAESLMVCIADCSGHPLYQPALPARQRWVRCRGCDHVYVDGWFDDEALALLRAETQPHQEPGFDVEGGRSIAARVIEDVMGQRPGGATGRWLDVGFGSGALLTTAAEFGWDVVGIDVREDSVRRLRAFGFDVRQADFLELPPEQPFDVVSLADVLEHMPFPRPALAHARALLAGGGLLFLSMPNSDCFVWDELTRTGKNPYWAELEHYHNFGRRRLYRLLAEHGFEARHYAVSRRYRAGMEVIAYKQS